MVESMFFTGCCKNLDLGHSDVSYSRPEPYQLYTGEYVVTTARAPFCFKISAGTQRINLSASTELGMLRLADANSSSRSVELNFPRTASLCDDLGIKLQQDHEFPWALSIVITNVLGAIAEWNALAVLEKATGETGSVDPSDVVRAVNGISGDTDAMLKEFMSMCTSGEAGQLLLDVWPRPCLKAFVASQRLSFQVGTPMRELRQSDDCTAPASTEVCEVPKISLAKKNDYKKSGAYPAGEDFEDFEDFMVEDDDSDTLSLVLPRHRPAMTS